MKDRKRADAPPALPAPVPPTEVASDILNGAADLAGDLKEGLKHGPFEVAERGLRRLGSPPDNIRRKKR